MSAIEIWIGLKAQPQDVTAIKEQELQLLSKELKDVGDEFTQHIHSIVNEVVANFFQQLNTQIQKQEYYRNLYRLLGNDSGIEQNLKQLETILSSALINAARVECDRYVRERPEFFTEGTSSLFTSSLFQLRQTLQQACRGYDWQSDDLPCSDYRTDRQNKDF